MNKNFKIPKSITSRNDLINAYFRDIRNIPILTEEEEQELLLKAQDGDNEAVNKLIESNLRFVVSIAKQYQGRGLELIDLISEGNFGLIEAIKSFDQSRNVRFLSYAIWWIKQCIGNAIVKYGKTVKLPISQILKITKMNKIGKEIEQLEQRYPSLEELEQEMNMDKKKILKAQNFGSVSIPIDSKLRDDDNFMLLDIIPNDSAMPDKELMDESVKLFVKKLLTKLTKREAKVLTLNFGIDCDPLPVYEIGKLLKLTDERVRQIKNEALQKLQEEYKNLSKELL